MKLEEILTSENIIESINNNLDYLFVIIPELKSMVGFDHKNPHHHLDVWNHTLYALSLSENNYVIRLTLLLHDIGKPSCYVEGDVRHFTGHPHKSKEISYIILNRLGYEKEFIDKICYLIDNHDLPISKSKIKVDRELELLRFKIQRCDTLAHNPDELEMRKQYVKKVEKYFEEIK